MTLGGSSAAGCPEFLGRMAGRSAALFRRHTCPGFSPCSAALLRRARRVPLCRGGAPLFSRSLLSCEFAAFRRNSGTCIFRHRPTLFECHARLSLFRGGAALVRRHIRLPLFRDSAELLRRRGGKLFLPPGAPRFGRASSFTYLRRRAPHFESHMGVGFFHRRAALLERPPSADDSLASIGAIYQLRSSRAIESNPTLFGFGPVITESCFNDFNQRPQARFDERQQPLMPMACGPLRDDFAYMPAHAPFQL